MVIEQSCNNSVGSWARGNSQKEVRDYGRNTISIIHYVARHHDQKAGTCKSPWQGREFGGVGACQGHGEVQADSPKSGRDCGRSTSTTEHDIMSRKLEHANPHSRGVNLERVGSWCGHGGCSGISKKWPGLWQEHIND